MLAFFRKYEKTFFLIVFLPAIIGMGVTSVIVTVLTQKPESSPGRCFDEPIPLHDWLSVTGPRAKMFPREEQEKRYEFYAETKAAERAGVHIPEEKLGKKIKEETGRYIASRRAEERIRDEGINPQTEEGRRKFISYYMQEMANPEKNFTDEDYATFISGYGMNMQEFENYQRHVLEFETLKDSFRLAATVSPEDVWKEYHDKNHKREAELVAIDGAAYIPSATTVPTEEEIKAHYEAHRAEYDEPKKVSLEYVAAVFDKVRPELPAPAEETLKAYYEKHTGQYTAWVGTVAVVSSFSDVRDKVLDAVQTQAAKDTAESLRDQVEAKLKEQLKAGKVDMKAAMAAVAATNTSSTVKALEYGTTPLLEIDDYYTQPVLTGYVARNWAETKPASPTVVSEGLKGEKAAYVLRTADVKERFVPTYEQIHDQVRKDFLFGGERELKKYHHDNEWRYRTNDKWKFDVAYVYFEELAKNDPSITATDGQVNAFWAQKHDLLWPGKDAATVGSDAIALACKTEMAKPRASQILNQLRSEAQRNVTDHNEARLETAVQSDKFLWVHVDKGISLDGTELDQDMRFKRAANAIRLAKKEDPSEAFTQADEKGMFIFALRDKIEHKVPELDEIRDKVQKDVLQARGYERAKEAAKKLLLEMRDLKGDAIAPALSAHNLVATRTGFFARGTTTLPGAGTEATQIVAETFNAKAPGGFEKAVNDDVNRKVWLVRYASRQDPDDDKLTASDRTMIRKEVLNRTKNAYAERKHTEILRHAKGISDEHVKWVRERRDGPGGRISSEVRQIFVPNDKATIDGWLEDAARHRIDEAMAKLKANEKWEKVCMDYSDDEATRARGGEWTFQRFELSETYGDEFARAVFELPADGQPSAPLKSKRGIHIVKVKKAPVAGAPDDPAHGILRITIQQIIVKMDPKLRNMPAEIEAKARDIAKKKIDDAKARIDKGEPFAKVAAEVGAEGDQRARGEAFTVPYLSDVAIEAYKLPFEVVDPSKVEPFEVKIGAASEWHLDFATRDPQDREAPDKAQNSFSPRLVYECVGPTKDSVLAARRELEAWVKERATGDHAATAQELLKEFKRVAAKYSTADSGKKEGAFGVLTIDDAQLRTIDAPALIAMATLEKGAKTDIVATK
ncbi:MAG TPA: peptidylprolyl isomerase, partial [Planctomycetota bacterium]|nr:peptidylprolyl isomerase [Planctomycetota bacterium]